MYIYSLSDSGHPKWIALLVDAPVVLCDLNVVTSIPAHSMTSFIQRAKVSLDIRWCGLPCVMKNWVHYAWEAIGLLGLQDLKRYYLSSNIRNIDLWSLQLV